MSGPPDEQKDIYNKNGTVIVVESTYSSDGRTLKEILSLIHISEPTRPY